jgi:hypothetical protein
MRAQPDQQHEQGGQKKAEACSGLSSSDASWRRAELIHLLNL